MSRLYRIRNWNDLFENNRSRELKKVNWVVVPNKHDGETYATIMRHEKAAEIFSAWVIMLQIASKCTPRGTLIKGDGTPHIPQSLAVKSQAPAGWFELCISYLETNTDWLEWDELTTNPAPSCGNPAPRDEERREGNGKKEWNGTPAASLSQDIQEVFDSWNRLRGLPHCLVVSDSRRRTIRVRLVDPFFKANWKLALAKIEQSDFCRGGSERGWRASFDWFIRPDSVAKVMEGKYDKANSAPPPKQKTLLEKEIAAMARHYQNNPP